MAEPKKRMLRRPTMTTMVAAALVIGGFLLTGVSWWFLLLAAAGAFGPGILREFGVLRDKDEFQRRAAHRAGYHAFLVVGVVAFVFVAFFRSADRAIENTHRLATIFLGLLWFTWLLSSLLSYWGPQKTAARMLYAFGVVWLVFAVVSNLGSEWTGWAALLLHPLLAAPFFALAWLSGRRPRLAGAILLVVAIFLFVFLQAFRLVGPGGMTDGVVPIFFIGPLLACGIALLTVRGDADAEESEDPGSPVGAAATT